MSKPTPLINFKFVDSIFQKDDFSNTKEYIPTIDTDYGDEGIRLNCNKKEYKLENLSFDKYVQIGLKAPANIEITNCVFKYSLSIQIDSPDDIKDINIHIYKTNIHGRLTIGRSAAYQNISVDSSAIKDLFIVDNSVNSIDVFRSEIFEINFEGSKVGDIILTNSFINILKYYHTRFDEVDIDAKSFSRYHKSIRKIKPRDFYSEYLYKSIEEINKFKEVLRKKKFPPDKTKSECKSIIKHNIKVCKESIAKSKKDARQFYLDFLILLKKSRDISIDSQIVSDLNYNYYRYKEYNPIIFIIMWLLGFFYRPFRIILSSIVVIIFFGLIYYGMSHLEELFIFSNAETVVYELANSIYFSGITFYTIGYSDLMDIIVRKDLIFLKQILILVEGCLGIIFTSSIVISLLNKYRIRA